MKRYELVAPYCRDRRLSGFPRISVNNVPVLHFLTEHPKQPFFPKGVVEAGLPIALLARDKPG
jgi:hypothetical protein